MPVRYIHMPVFGAYTYPQIRLSACLNRLFSMFADDRELQKSIASNLPYHYYLHQHYGRRRRMEWFKLLRRRRGKGLR